MIGTLAGIRTKAISSLAVQFSRNDMNRSWLSLVRLSLTNRENVLMDQKYSPQHQQKLIIALTLILLLGEGWFSSNLSAQDQLGVQVPDGFEVTLFADDDLAHDIYSMTIDSYGRVVVSGAGYVKILVDADQDGKADEAKVFVNGPKSGAQGMYFAGPDLLCAGDGGLIRYKDRNSDDVADGPPDTFWKTKTGGEHDLHAMRKGPDGWWYAIAGNYAEITEKYITLETSPVKKPLAGTILRFKPDLSGSEIYAHGFRNAYDFDFGHAGDIFSFDSDGERDISLPWYRPTRVYHVLPGSHQGWQTRSWKRPNWFFDMPPVVGAFGRGSPTGVETYRHTQFPESYHGALFVLDWTYGRVITMPMQQDGSTWSCEPIDFMTAIGQHGFAPTDVAVGINGELYVSVGGRGTRGGVYRITATAPSDAHPQTTFGTSPNLSRAEKVQRCLQAPQPLSSWSRRIWEPLVEELTSEPFINAAMDRSLPTNERVRAIEILTEKFGGLDGDLVYGTAADPDPVVRARVAWSLGRSAPAEPGFRDLSQFLKDQHPLVVRSAMEALISAKPEVLKDYVDSIGAVLGSEDKFVRQSAMRLLINMDNQTFRDVAAVGFKTGWNASIPVAAAYAIKVGNLQKYPIDIAVRILNSDRDNKLKLEAVRVLQLGLGDLVPDQSDVAAVYDGYASPAPLSDNPEVVKFVADSMEKLYPSGNEQLDREYERVLSMIQSASPKLLQALLQKLTEESHPVEDIHLLIVASRMSAQRTSEQTATIARALVNLESKIAARKLRQDSNWADRTLEMYLVLAEKDGALPLAILNTPGFGAPGHVQFISTFPPESFDAAITAFSKQIRSNPDYEWSSDVILLLAESLEPTDQELLREKFDDFAMRNSVIIALASNPQEADRKYFYKALDTATLETIQQCISALGLLPPSEDAEENVALVYALKRMGNKEEELRVRDQIVELLRRNMKTQFGYKFGKTGSHQKEVIDLWTETVREKFPESFAAQTGTEETGIDDLKSRLAAIDWSQGDEAAGQSLFKKRACAQCHGGRSALGPDLSGVAGRFSQEDLFTAIVFPNRDVSPRYQTTQIVTQNGQIRSGLIVYESVDGLVLRDSNNQTYRIEADEIEVKRRRNQSLMPAGLLKDLSDADLANLYAYMRSLSNRQTANAAKR